MYLDLCVEVHDWIDGLPKPSRPPANSKAMVAQHAVHVRAPNYRPCRPPSVDIFQRCPSCSFVMRCL